VLQAPPESGTSFRGCRIAGFLGIQEDYTVFFVVGTGLAAGLRAVDPAVAGVVFHPRGRLSGITEERRRSRSAD